MDDELPSPVGAGPSTRCGDLGCGELFPGQIGLMKERRPGREVTAGHGTLRMD